MTKKDIEAGDLVLLRDGRVCIVRKEEDGVLLLYGKPYYVSYPAITRINKLDNYNNDLTDGDYHKYDIIAVSKRSGTLFLGNYLIDILLSKVTLSDVFWDWEREKVKEVTMSEVEEKFGCKVKIIKEEN